MSVEHLQHIHGFVIIYVSENEFIQIWTVLILEIATYMSLHYIYLCV